MKYFFYLSIALLIVFAACNDSVLVGSELLGEESVDVEFIDDLAIPAKTILGDSSLTFRKQDGDGYPIRTYMIGSVDDNVFGRSTTTTYFSPVIISAVPDFSVQTLDSVVMVMRLDSLGRYGDGSATHDISLSVLNERMDVGDREDFYSNLKLEAEATQIYSGSHVINYEDSLDINLYFLDSITQVVPQLRFPLDKQYWIDLSTNPSDSIIESNFLDILPGFELKSTPSTNSVFGISLGYDDQRGDSEIIFYYNSSDTTRSTYRIPLGKYRHSHYQKEIGGSELEANLEDTAADCLYLESQSGANIELDMSALSTGITNRIVNNATLEVNVKPFDEELYPAIEAISAWYKDADGAYVRADRSDLLSSITETYPKGEQLWTYSVDITGYVNSVKNGTQTFTDLILLPVSKSERANRSLIYGTSDLEHPLKLNLVLTKP